MVTKRMKRLRTAWMAGVLVGTAFVCAANVSVAQDKGKSDAAELTSESNASLQQLTASVPVAKALAPTAVAILVFPKVTKAGLGIGGQYGEGTLLKKGAAAGYYKTTGASFGLQAGGQQYGYAMFFMNAKALADFESASGFEVGVGPSVVAHRRGQGEDHHDQHDEGRHLRVRVRAERPDGWPRHSRQQDHEDYPEVTRAADALPVVDHSWRSATIGSTRDARRAGP